MTRSQLRVVFQPVDILHGSMKLVWALPLVGLFLAPRAMAECCPSHDLVCGDCTLGTPYCGKGKCNIFGCNCDGGCRTGVCSNSLSAESRFTMADSDGDKKISLDELKGWAQQRSKQFADDAAAKAEFDKLDTDKSGSIELKEIDSPSKGQAPTQPAKKKVDSSSKGQAPTQPAR